MQDTISSLYLKRPGIIFTVTDEELLEKMPSLRGQALTVSVIKRSGPRTMVQYFGPNGAGTLKLIKDYKIEIQGESQTSTLSSIIGKYKFKDSRPLRIKVNCNGEIAEYVISQEFWDQTSTNIRLKGLQRFGSKYKVPGSCLVLEEKFD